MIERQEARETVIPSAAGDPFGAAILQLLAPAPRTRFTLALSPLGRGKLEEGTSASKRGPSSLRSSG